MKACILTSRNVAFEDLILGAYGHLMNRFGHLWAPHSGHSWPLRENVGQTKVLVTIALSKKFCGAGDGDRTRMASLEGWSSTIELHPRVSWRPGKTF
jgi:hypothetical protein